MSKASQQRGKELEKNKPKCPYCKIAMEKTILKMHFPYGSLPVVGFECAGCGEEVIRADVAEETQKLARNLGLFGPEYSLIRKITKSGRQLALYLPKEIEKSFGLVSGRKVKIFKRGKEIVVHPV